MKPDTEHAPCYLPHPAFDRIYLNFPVAAAADAAIGRRVPWPFRKSGRLACWLHPRRMPNSGRPACGSQAYRWPRRTADISPLGASSWQPPEPDLSCLSPLTGPQAVSLRREMSCPQPLDSIGPALLSGMPAGVCIEGLQRLDPVGEFCAGAVAPGSGPADERPEGVQVTHLYQQPKPRPFS